MDIRIGNKPEVQPDTVINKLGSEEGGKWIITNAHYYSEDGYIDTLKIINTSYESNLRLSLAYIASISTYAKENNKLISKDTYYDHKFSVLSSRESFEYDSIGRLTKNHYISYDMDQEIIHDVTHEYDLKTVKNTDNGYIFNGVEYCFDEKDRLSKEIRDKDTLKYTYYDNILGYNRILKKNEASDKEEYFFEENGLVAKSIQHYSWDPNTKSISESFYYFSSGNATSNSLVTNIPEIYGTTGSLIINAVQSEWINIYTLSGQLVRKEYINQNQQIPLPKGIYIVKSTNKTFKVVVK